MAVSSGTWVTFDRRCMWEGCGRVLPTAYGLCLPGRQADGLPLLACCLHGNLLVPCRHPGGFNMSNIIRLFLDFHASLGRGLGITEQEFERLRARSILAGWTQLERDLLAAANDPHRDHRIGAQTWNSL